MSRLDPECPGPDCPMCSGAMCNLCGAGCWDARVRTGADRCEHASDERHREPGRIARPARSMTRAEILALVLPVEDHRVSVEPDGTRRPCVYRYASEAQRDRHLVEEARVLSEPRSTR